MSDKKTQEVINKLEKYRETLVDNKSASKELLLKAGIINSKGDLTSNYKHLCIPQKQV